MLIRKKKVYTLFFESAVKQIPADKIKQEDFKSESQKNLITPPVTFKSSGEVPPCQAIYIKAFDEIFTQLKDQKEATQLLMNIEEMLSNKKLAVFIDVPVPRKEIKKILKQVRFVFANFLKEKRQAALKEVRSAQYTRIEQIIIRQMKYGLTLEWFKLRCQRRKISTVYMGGVYGRACVWVAAKDLAKNIFSKQLGDEHPNIRYQALDGSRFRFENAVIWPAICEGYQYYPYTFAQFIHFPETALFQIRMAEGAARGYDREFLKARYKEAKAIGQSYERHISDDPNMPKKLVAFKALHHTIQNLKDTKTDNPNKLFSSSQAEKHDTTTTAAPGAIAVNDGVDFSPVIKIRKFLKD